MISREPVSRYPVSRGNAWAVGGGPQTFFQDVNGTLSFAGNLTRRTDKLLNGAITPQGVLARQTNKLLDGVLSFAGTLQSVIVFTITLAGVLTFGGELTKQTQKSLGGNVDFAGTLVKQTQKLLQGNLTFVGALIKQTNRTLTGVLTFSGALQAGVVFQRAVSGVLSFAGALATQFIPNAGTSIRRFWRSIWSRMWRDPGQKDIDN